MLARSAIALGRVLRVKSECQATQKIQAIILSMRFSLEAGVLSLVV